jgi:metal-responsive CopG/Arc/MetJ family transcriptional regulator
MTKFAITLPEHQAQAVERIRRAQRIPRSRVIQHAVDLYLSRQAQQEAIGAYEEGYRRRPEAAAEAESAARAAGEVLGREDWG